MEKFLKENKLKISLFLKRKILFRIILTAVFLLGLITRFYFLGQVPASMNRDEAAIGYNSFSILKIGQDEWGEKFPLAFKSFGDYKSPFYIYLTVLPVYIFGLCEFSVRFWGAAAGFLLIAVAYFIIIRLFNKPEKKTALITAFLVAIGSWQIFYSRFSFEANLGLLFNFLALLFMLKDEFKKISFLSSLFLIFSLLTYSSSLIIWPLFLFIWSLFLIKNAIKKKIDKSELAKLLTLVIILLVVFYSQIIIGGQKSKITIFGNTQLRLDFNERRAEIASHSLWQARLFYNQYLFYGKIFLKNYLKSFSPNFLFGGGGQHPWHKIPQVAHFYPVFLVIILVGFALFLKTDKISRDKKLFLLLFLFLTPISSAITTDSPHATRLLNLFFLLSIYAGLGMTWLLEKLKLLGWLIMLTLVFNFINFNKLYFVDFRQNPPGNILPGIKQAITKLDEIELKPDVIIFDSHTDGSSMYLVFYQQYPPAEFIKKVKRYTPDTAGFEWIERLDDYIFVSNARPNPSYKEIYVLHNGTNFGEKIIYQIKNKYNGKVNYTIQTNF